jgi:hypothetical protein
MLLKTLVDHHDSVVAANAAMGTYITVTAAFLDEVPNNASLLSFASSLHGSCGGAEK